MKTQKIFLVLLFALLLWVVFLSGCDDMRINCIQRGMTKGEKTPALTYEQAKEVCGIE